MKPIYKFKRDMWGNFRDIESPEDHLFYIQYDIYFCDGKTITIQMTPEDALQLLRSNTNGLRKMAKSLKRRNAVRKMITWMQKP